MKNFCKPSLVLACALMAQASVCHAQAQVQDQSPVSVPYTPTWQTRHHLQ